MKKQRKITNVKKLTKHIKEFKETCLNNKQNINRLNKVIENLIIEFQIELEKVKNIKEV